MNTPDPGPPTVFVNYPFDAGFAGNLDAIVLACVACGFRPTDATASGAVGEPRIQRIFQALSEARYSVHDLSRCRGEGDENIARFNMPLELGMAMALAFAGGRHQWAALVPEGTSHQLYVSDLDAYDPICYHGEGSLVSGLLAWLPTLVGAGPAVWPPDILALLPGFRARQARRADGWKGQRLPWFERIALAVSMVAQARGSGEDPGAARG